MPQELVLVYEKATGKPSYMHSVDAAEAVRLGDYVSMPPSGHVDDAAVARAMQQASGIGTASHPELQTPEERQMHRDEANAAAAMAAQQAARMAGAIVLPSPLVPTPYVSHGMMSDAPMEVEKSGPPLPATRSTAAEAMVDADKPGPSIPVTRSGSERK